MKAYLVLAHPEPRSFNSQLAGVAAERLEHLGYEVTTSDLYREDFEPREQGSHYTTRADDGFFNAMREQRHSSDNDSLPTDIRRTIGRLEEADFVFFQFPLWWWGPPAILKGWLDRVFVWGRVYSSKVRYRDHGHFRGKKAMVSVSVGAPESAYGSDGRCGDLGLVLWPFHFSLSYVGFSVLPHFASYEVTDSPGTDKQELRVRLEQYKEKLAHRLSRIAATEPLGFNGFEDWDSKGRLKTDAPSYGPFIRHVE